MQYKLRNQFEKLIAVIFCDFLEYMNSVACGGLVGCDNDGCHFSQNFRASAYQASQGKSAYLRSAPCWECNHIHGNNLSVVRCGVCTWHKPTALLRRIDFSHTSCGTKASLTVNPRLCRYLVSRNNVLVFDARP